MPEAQASPVFVDPTGRRARRAGLLGKGLAVLCVLYLAFVAVALVASPGVLPLSIPGLGPLLPGPGAPPLADAAGHPARPAVFLTPHPSPPSTLPNQRQSSSPQPPLVGGLGGTPTSSPRPGQGHGPPQRTARPTPTTSPVPSPTASPTASPTPRAHGRPTTSPSPTASPTPHRTGKP